MLCTLQSWNMGWRLYGKPLINNKCLTKVKELLFIHSNMCRIFCVPGMCFGWKEKASPSGSWGAITSSITNKQWGKPQQWLKDGGDQPSLETWRCIGVMVGGGLRKACAEENFRLHCGIHITPRQVVKDGQGFSRERCRDAGDPWDFFRKSVRLKLF